MEPAELGVLYGIWVFMVNNWVFLLIMNFIFGTILATMFYIDGVSPRRRIMAFLLGLPSVIAIVIILIIAFFYVILFTTD